MYKATFTLVICSSVLFGEQNDTSAPFANGAEKNPFTIVGFACKYKRTWTLLADGATLASGTLMWTYPNFPQGSNKVRKIDFYKCVLFR